MSNGWLTSLRHIFLKNMQKIYNPLMKTLQIKKVCREENFPTLGAGNKEENYFSSAGAKVTSSMVMMT